MYVRFMPAAALLAGALALAGCGGGSGGSTSVSNQDPDLNPPVTPETKKTLDLPEDYVLGSSNSTLPQTFVIPAGETLDATIIGMGASSLFFTCTGDEDCTITLPAGQRQTGKVEYGGGTLTHSKADPRKTAGRDTGRTERSDAPGGDSGPFSDETIAEALKATNRKTTVWGLTGDGAVDFTDTQSFVNIDGETLALTLDGDAALYWGNWHKYKAPATASGKRTGETLGQIYGGTTPEYGKKPETSIAKAVYEVEDAVNLQFKSGSGDWTGNAGDTADLDLEANFKSGMVGGSINEIQAVTAVDFPDTITLKETAIGSTGGFSGDAEFKGTDHTRKSGSWEGKFYGPTTRVQGNKQEHVMPSHAAGTFSASGRTKGDSPEDLHIRGAFGATGAVKTD